MRPLLPALALPLLASLSAIPLAAAPASAKPAATTAPAIDPALAAAIADPRRVEDQARDKWRHPAETLSFFGVTPEMKVGEYAPGGGWYSRLLGLYLGPRGKLVGLFFDPSQPVFPEKNKQGIRDGAAKYPADVAGWSGQPAERFAAMTLDTVPDAEKGTFDRILIVRMFHNMIRNGLADGDLREMRDLLKPGGMIGIVQHRARPGTPYAYADGNKGYMLEEDVVKFVEANGFELVGRSEINANPNDPADWPDGVWTLPPNLRKGETDRDRYLAVGESDRMTLLFRKRP